MIIKGNLKVGSTSLQFEAEGSDSGEMKAIHKVIALSNPRKECNVCHDEDNNNREIFSNISKEFIFVKIMCTKCGSISQLGQYKSGGYFWKEFKKYNKGEEDKVEE